MADDDAVVDQARAWVAAARRVVVLTGAGVSTDSGIPDFRGPSGVWTTNPGAERASTLQHYLAEPETRRAAWRNRLSSPAFSAMPNAAHAALVDLERSGRLDTLVTQNIDGLHHKAGNTNVVEIHGTNRLVECLDCGQTTDPEWAFEEFKRTGKCPLCKSCGGLCKTATISFGQPMPQELVQRALEAALQCDLVLALGSSLQVEPAASIPLAAWRNGATYVIINQGPTAHDKVAQIRLEGDLTELVPALL